MYDSYIRNNASNMQWCLCGLNQPIILLSMRSMWNVKITIFSEDSDFLPLIAVTVMLRHSKIMKFTVLPTTESS